jgi:hypothetical protein
VAAPALDALAAHALALAWTCSLPAALVAGVLYGFAPLRFEEDLCQVQMLAAWWLPLMLLFARRTLEHGRTRDAMLTGVTVAMQGLTGIYLTAFFLPFLVVAHLWWMRAVPPSAHPARWGRLVAAEAAALLVLAVPAVAYRAVQRDLGASRSLMVNALLSVTLDRLPAYVPLLAFAGGLLLAALLRRALPPRLAREAPLLWGMLVGGMLLAAGPAIALPGNLGSVRGPYGLLRALPGFDALRAPGRCMHVALLAGAVLVGGGVAAAGRRWSPPTAVAAALALLAIAAAQTPGPRARLVDAMSPTAVAVGGWMRAQREPVRYVELPLDELAGWAQRYQAASVLHWRPTLSGNMGILPPMYPWMVRQLARFPDADVLASVRALGLTHAVVHMDALPPAVAARVERASQGPEAPLDLRWSAGETRIYALRPGPLPVPLRPRGARLPRRGWRVMASHGRGVAARAIDADPRSAWSSHADLDAALRRWWQPTTPLVLWSRFLSEQPTTLAVDLGQPAAITTVDLRLGGSEPQALPDLALETSDDGVVWRPFGAPLRPVPDVRGLVRHAARARFAALPDAPVRARWVRLTGGALEIRVADFSVRVRRGSTTAEHAG